MSRIRHTEKKTELVPGPGSTVQAEVRLPEPEDLGHEPDELGVGLAVHGRGRHSHAHSLLTVRVNSLEKVDIFTTEDVNEIILQIFRALRSLPRQIRQFCETENLVRYFTVKE
jgi:hypothetical protein